MLIAMTLLLGRADLARLLDIDACLAALTTGFLADPAPIAAHRVRTDLPGEHGTATALLPGLLAGVPAYTVKVNAKFPAARPALRGVVCLHDLTTGELLALLDSTVITAWRTGLAAALATHALARPDAASVTVIGAGAQSDLVLRGLATLRSWSSLAVHDLDPTRATDFAARHDGAVASEVRHDDAAASGVQDGRADPSGVQHGGAVGSGVRHGSAVASAVAPGEITILATWSRTPLLDNADVPAGAHVTSLGADEPGKAELTPALLAESRVIVDDVPLALTSGALGTAGLTADACVGTLTDVLRGAIPARAAETDRTIYTPVGLPWQDLCLAWLAYHRATGSGTGTTFDFLT